MKKLIILFSTFYIVAFSVFGQENVLYYEVQQAKNRNTYFENTNLQTVSPDFEALKNFINPNEVFFFGNISLDFRNNNVQAMNLQMPLGNKNMVLELVEVPEYFYDYVVTTSDGQNFSANRDIKHYRGIVQNENNSLVAITFYEDEIIGIVCTDEGNFNIAKDQQSGKHIFYNANNQKNKIYSSCGTLDDLSFSYDSEILFEEHLERGTPVRDEKVRFYVETEYDVYQNKGSALAVEVFVTSLFNQVSALYQNENILTCISKIYVWTSNDPYTGTISSEPTTLLDQFQNERTSFIGDLGMLLTFRANTGGGQGGSAGHMYNGLCNPLIKCRLAVAMISNIIEPIPIYSRTVKVVTHEFGHLLGSYHTHACKWGNTGKEAIDGCYEAELYGICANPGIPLKGTIMSYCDHDANLPGVDFNLGFGQQPGDRIRSKVTNATCLCRTEFTNKTVTTNTNIKGCELLLVQNVTIQNGVTVNISAQEEVVIKPGFHAMAGSNVRIYIDQSQAKSANADNYETTLTDLEKLSIIEQTDSDLIIYPNPNDGNFSVKIIGEINPYTIEIFNSSGGMLGTVNCDEELVGINRSDLNAGIYYVKLTMGNKVVVKKVIVQ